MISNNAQFSENHVKSTICNWLIKILFIIPALLVQSYALAEADGDLTSFGGVTEPIALRPTVSSTGSALNIFDFLLTDGGTSDGLAMNISQIVVNVSGTADESKVVFRLSGPDASNVVGTVGVNTITFSGLTISVPDGAAEIYTINAYYGDNTGLIDNQTYILSVDGDSDITSSGGTTMGVTTAVTNGTGSIVDVAATRTVFSTQPSASVLVNNNMGPVTIQAQDAAGNVDVDFGETITLTDENQATETNGPGILATTSNGNSLAVAATGGQASWANLTYNASGSINIDANSIHYNVESTNVSVTEDGDGTLTASAAVTEPIALASTTITTGAAQNIFDFTLTDGGTSDGLSMDISQIVINVSGTADESKVVFRLNGPDASNVVGTVGGNTITFSGLGISVADGASEVYTINAYYGDNTGLTDNQTYILSVDGDTDVTASAGTTMAATTAVTNGTGSIVDVAATGLVFTVQPNPSVITNINLGPVTLQAQDAAGNVDIDFVETVTLTDELQASETNGPGTLATTSNSNSLSVAATAGQVSWANLTYNEGAVINVDANSSSFNVESNNTLVTKNADGDLTASGTVIEPITLPSTVQTAGTARDIFDFTLTDHGTSDSLAMNISNIVVHLSGTADKSKTTFRLNGPDVANVVGVVGANTITFSGLAISVADGTSEVYTVNAYFSNNTGLTDNQTYILSIDGDTDVTSSGGTTVGATTAVNNGTGSIVTVLATQMVFVTQPAASILQNANMGPVSIQARDAAGNIDVDFTETVTLTDENQGTEVDGTGILATTSNNNSLSTPAVGGQVSWATLTYDSVANINIDANSISLNAESTVVNVTDIAPLITQGSSVNVVMDEDSNPIKFSLTLNTTDTSNDTLTWSIQSPASNGAASTSGTGSSKQISYIPKQNYNGSDSFVVKAQDSHGLSDTINVTVTINSINDTPVATDQNINANEDKATAIVLTATDIDGDSLTYAIVNSPQNGSLSGPIDKLTYTPNNNYSGNDSFTFKANDGVIDSAVATINIAVSNNNDAPIALDDDVTTRIDEAVEITVLSNDSDADGDPLTVVTTSAAIGVSVISNNNTIVYTPAFGFTGDVVVNYAITDGKDGHATAEVLVHVIANTESDNPTLTVPADIEANAKGFFTQIDLGFATAKDSIGNPIPVVLLRDNNSFKSGINYVYWQATDALGNVAIESQIVKVSPLITLAADQIIVEGQSVSIAIQLSGESPQYPLEVAYSLSGSADFSDHDLIDTKIRIASGTTGSIEFMIVDDGPGEDDELLQLTLDPELNSNAATHTVTLTEKNVPPVISLEARQNEKQTIVVARDQGDVIVSANLNDGNVTDNHTYDWSGSSDELIDSAFEDSIFGFSPIGLANGTYEIKLLVSDDGIPVLKTEDILLIEITDSLPLLTSDDSDKDGIPDINEGIGDTDGDGIPDYLDNIDSCNILVEFVDEYTSALIEGGVDGCLTVGTVAMGGESGGALILEDSTLSNDIPADSDATNIGGIFDFIITDIPITGQTYSIVLPQLQTIPANAVYRKYKSNTGWINFFEDDNNTLSSAHGESGYCPQPDSPQYESGLIEGYWCVRLVLEDGGPNDADGIANRFIEDPGGIAILNSANEFPDAIDDYLLIGKNETVTIDVLANDVDADNDELNIISANALYGLLEINDNSLSYTAPEQYLGDDKIFYVITDGNGGTDNANVTIQIRNRVPKVINESVSTIEEVSVTVDVLSNDSDADNDTLSVFSAVSEFGTVTINVDQSITYTPVAGFAGIDYIQYEVSDGVGGITKGSVSVLVRFSGGGGTFDYFWIVLLLILFYFRERSLASV